MNEEAFNMSIRKFLKEVGVTSQREIESAVRGALASGALGGDQSVSVHVTLVIDELGIEHRIDGAIDLV